MGNEDRATLWAGWLRDMLGSRTWSQADLVRASDNEIQADRVSKWLAAKEAPSHRFVIVTANALGVSHAEALKAAGFSTAGASTSIPDPLAMLDVDTRVARGKLQPYTDQQLLAELLHRAQERETSNVVDFPSVRRADDASVSDELPYRSHGELAERNLEKGAALKDDQEVLGDDGDDARPRT